MGTGLVLAVSGLVVVLAALLVNLYRNQGSLVYFPERTLRFTPADLEMAFDDVRLTTSDEVVLAACWVPAAHPRGAVVLCHGNAGNIGDRIAKIRLLRDLGLSVLAFDYRGYGASAGRPCEDGLARDVDAAVTHAQAVRRLPVERTVLYGESLGGAVAVAAAARKPPGLLVLESTFTSAREMARRHYPFVPPALVRVGYDSLGRIGAVGCPTLILHGPHDTIVPFEMAEELFNAAPEPKYFATLEGDHNAGGIVVSRDAFEALTAFLDAYLGAANRP